MRTASSILHSPVFVVPTVALLGCTGCIPALPENLDVPSPARTPVKTEAGATFYAEPNLDDGWWVEVPRLGEPGAVGGYLLDKPDHRGALIVVLPGASSFFDGGMVEKTRAYHEEHLGPYQNAGYLTWSLAVRECGTPYGQGDFADLRAALAWLEQGGREALAAERVCLLGYSSGGLPVLLANLESDVTAVASIGSLTQPDQFERFRPLYRLVVALYPDNAGICQFGSTLRGYGPPGSAAWSAIDVVSRVAASRSPTLVIHGADDAVYLPRNARALEAAYEAARESGSDLPQFEFALIPDAGHVTIFDDPRTIERVLEFFGRFEPR